MNYAFVMYKSINNWLSPAAATANDDDECLTNENVSGACNSSHKVVNSNVISIATSSSSIGRLNLTSPITLTLHHINVMFSLIRLRRRMHEMQTIVADVHSVCQSVCHTAQLGFTVRRSFGAVFAKLLWPFVSLLTVMHSRVELLCYMFTVCDQIFSFMGFIERATCIMWPIVTDDPIAWCDSLSLSPSLSVCHVDA